MAMPRPVQRLKHGVILCKKNFVTFVETFNFLIDFAQNLRGDGDGHADGLITVDKSNPDNPVIRSKRGLSFFDRLESKLYPKCFEISSLAVTSNPDNSVTVGLSLINCYVQVAGKTHNFSASTAPLTHTISEDGQDVLSLEIGATYTSTPTFAYRWDGQLEQMQMWQTDVTKMIVPLYQFNRYGEIVCDFRGIPMFAMGEWPL